MKSLNQMQRSISLFRVLDFELVVVIFETTVAGMMIKLAFIRVHTCFGSLWYFLS